MRGIASRAGIAALLLGFWAEPPRAQVVPTAEHSPVLRVSDAERPVTVGSLDVRVVVHGLYAETTQTLVFHNPNDRVLEGDLRFPLPDGATVNGYAIDVDGQLVDAVVVSKEKARVALETEVRRGADPGIVEQVRGNLYRTRVYPIPARGTRTVRLSWVSDLTTTGEAAAYHLPLPYDRPILDIGLRVEVVCSEGAPEISGGFGDVELRQWSDRWVAEARWKDLAPTRDLLVRLPRLPRRIVAVEPGDGGEAFFSVTDLVPKRQRRATSPRRVAVAWDGSRSRDAETTERELDLLGRLLDAWPDATVDLVLFRDRPEPARSFPPGPERAALFAILRAATRDGGTGLARLSLAKDALPHPDDVLWLLFSDGVGTVGDGLPAFGGVPIWPVTAATVADRALLRHLADATGGRLVDLVGATPAAAAALLVTPPVRLLDASGPVGAVADVRIQERSDPERVTVMGRLLSPEATLTLTFGDGAVSERRTVALRRAEAARTGERPGPVATAWAQGALELLGLSPEQNSAELLALGRRFGLVSGGTSLLVLETLEQHLTHTVEPAPSRRELRAKYFAALKVREMARRQTEAERIEDVVRRWGERVEWWERAPRVEDRMRQGEPATAPPPGGTRLEERVLLTQSRRTAPTLLEMEDSGDGLAEALGSRADRPVYVPRAAAGAEGSAAEPAGVDAAVVIRPWDPKTPWLAALRAADPARRYDAYLSLVPAYASPAFYLDCAGWFLQQGARELGLRILSNLAELRIDDAALLRVFAWRLLEAGEEELAVNVFEKVLRLRPEEAQSRRDLALALADLGESRGQPGDVARAIGLLWEVVKSPDARTRGIDLVALMELNRLAARAGRRGWAEQAAATGVDRRLLRPMTLDLRVALEWDVDATDVDLHVFEPTGEHAYYQHRRTAIGGLVSEDVTDGYGPEEYLIRRAPVGPYAVKAHYYGSRQQTLTGPATVRATVFTNWGRSDEKRQVMTLRLDAPRDEAPVGVATVGGR